METRYIVGLVVGVFIYIAAVSGLYLVFKDDIAYQREQLRKLKAKRKKAREMAEKAKSLNSSEMEKQDLKEEKNDN